MENNINALKQKIAFLEDGYAYQKDMADAYAKKLKEIWDEFDEFLAYFPDFETLKDQIMMNEIDCSDFFAHLVKVQNSIPESALRRVK